MADINVSRAFIIKNDVLRKKLHEGTNLTLKFWVDDKTSGGRKYSIELSSGWHHTQRKHPEKGTVEEILKIVETDSVTQADITKAAGCDITGDSGYFARYRFGTKSPLNPITREWILVVTPSKSDTSTIPA